MSRLVVEADGGSRGNPGPAGFGALVRDADTGAVLAEVAQAIGVATNNVAEYSGLVAGLQAAAAIDPGCTVEVRMDSRLVVEQMSGRWQIKHEGLRALAAQARAVLPPERVQYVWVPRERNKDADRLANDAMDAAARGEGRQTSTSAADSTSGSSSTAGSTSGAAEPAEHSAPSSTRAPRGPDTGEPTTLLLVRHGRTPLTEAQRFSGSDGEDPPLSEAGRQDAARVAALMARLATGDGAVPADVGRPAALLCSPMRRTRETAAFVAEATGLAPVVDERWIEAGFGEWEGLTFAEIIKGWPAQVARWQGSMSQAPPGGESLQHVVERVRAARRDVVDRNPGRVVVVVSHVTPVRAVVHEALSAGPAALWSVRIGPCSVTAVRFWRDGNAEVLGVNLTP